MHKTCFEKFGFVRSLDIFNYVFLHIFILYIKKLKKLNLYLLSVIPPVQLKMPGGKFPANYEPVKKR